MSDERDKIRTVLVVGAGTMGHGIAETCAASGLTVLLSDVSDEVLAGGLEKIRGSFARRVAKEKITQEEADRILSRITAGTDALALAGDADLVVEAVPENLELKKGILSRLDAATGPGTILATNTSSLSVTEIASATNRPERVLGAHFFNPVPVMPLLEIVRADGTSDRVVETVKAFGEGLGKEVIVVKDSPGFATSRLGVVLGLEAMRMLEQGVASAEDIDRAMELGYRHPMGPLRLTDLVGLDVRLDIAEHLHRELSGEQYRPPEILRRMVAEGKLGKKSGRGFYDW